MVRKAGERGPEQREGHRPRAGAQGDPYLEKNKLPGEAVPEPGAKWDVCASILPRKQPDTVCIQRGDKTTFVVTASTCLAFRTGGGCRRIDQGCVGREANDATMPTITAGPDRCDRDSLLQKTSACFVSGRAVL
jgi:hypothetical protein